MTQHAGFVRRNTVFRPFQHPCRPPCSTGRSTLCPRTRHPVDTIHHESSANCVHHTASSPCKSHGQAGFGSRNHPVPAEQTYHAKSQGRSHAITTGNSCPRSPACRTSRPSAVQVFSGQHPLHTMTACTRNPVQTHARLTGLCADPFCRQIRTMTAPAVPAEDDALPRPGLRATPPPASRQSVRWRRQTRQQTPARPVPCTGDGFRHAAARPPAASSLPHR